MYLPMYVHTVLSAVRNYWSARESALARPPASIIFLKWDSQQKCRILITCIRRKTYLLTLRMYHSFFSMSAAFNFWRQKNYMCT